MDLWAFGTSPAPMGLGLSHRRLLGLTPREYDALRKVWERQNKLTTAMFFQLRADIHNSSENLNRSDKQRWTAQDFGADAPLQVAEKPEANHGQLRTRLMMQFGPGKNGSVLGGLKGQSLPVDIQARIKKRA